MAQKATPQFSMRRSESHSSARDFGIWQRLRAEVNEGLVDSGTTKGNNIDIEELIISSCMSNFVIVLDEAELILTQHGRATPRKTPGLG